MQVIVYKPRENRTDLMVLPPRNRVLPVVILQAVTLDDLSGVLKAELDKVDSAPVQTPLF